MSRKILAITLALCLAVGIAVQISSAQEPKTLAERVAILEYRIEELTKKMEEQNQGLVIMLEIFQGQFAGVADKAKIGAAKAELATIKNGLGMYQAEDDRSAYPSTESIQNYNDLKDVLSRYIPLADEDRRSFTFMSYTSAHRDTFVLRARAKDSARTIITVTPTVIKP